MPMFIAAAIAQAFTISLVAAQMITGALMIGASLVMSSAQKRKAKRQAREQNNASQIDRLATIDSAVQPRHLVLGRVRKAGQVFMRGAYGPSNSRFTMAVELAFHEIDAVEKVFFNDVELQLDAFGRVLNAPYSRIKTESDSAVAAGVSTVLANPPVAGSVTVYKMVDEVQKAVPFTLVGSTVTIAAGDVGATINYQWQDVNSSASVTWFLGSPDQVVSTRMQTAFPTLWTAEHRARGTAYLVCEFQFDETSFPTGLPNVTAQVRGAKVYDPRTGLTGWTENPALLMRHVYTHPFFGNRTASADVDLRITAAANVCDTVVNYSVDGQVTARPMFTAGLVAQFGGAARDVFDDLSQSMGGGWAYGRGELFVRAGAYTAPVMTLTEADLAVEVRSTESTEFEQQPISISVHRARNDKFNVANIRIWDAGQGFKEAALTPLKAPALIARDGAELPREISMAAVGYAPQALHIAGIGMRDERDSLTVVLSLKMRAYPLELFDTVLLTLARYGWSAKEFMVIGREWDLNGLIKLTMKETAAAIYTMDADFLPQGYADNTSLPAPWEIDPPSPLAVTSGTAELVVQNGQVLTRVRVSWPVMLDQAVLDGGTLEVQHQQLGATEWSSITMAGTATEVYINDVEDGQTIIVRARSRSRLAVSDWGLQIVHSVVGKSEPPSDVSAVFMNGDVLTWPAVPDVDIAGYRLRFIQGGRANWEGGTALHVGIITESPYELISRPSGLVTFMVKAVDTSGNESETPAYVTSIGSVTLYGNTLESYPQAPAFLGSIAGGAIVADALAANNTGTLFWGGPANLFWNVDNTQLFWGATSFVEMVYTFAFGVSASGILALDSLIAGEVVAIEIRRPGVTPFWTGNANNFWTADPNAFWAANPNDWEPWPGTLTVQAGDYLEMRVTTSAGATQGLITSLTPFLDVPTVEEFIDDATIAAVGARLALTRIFRVVRNVQVTIQQDGGSGTSAVIVDKQNTGPLIQVLDRDGLAVTGMVDARVKGY